MSNPRKTYRTLSKDAVANLSSAAKLPLPAAGFGYSQISCTIIVCIFQECFPKSLSARACFLKSARRLGIDDSSNRPNLNAPPKCQRLAAIAKMQYILRRVQDKFIFRIICCVGRGFVQQARIVSAAERSSLLRCGDARIFVVIGKK